MGEGACMCSLTIDWRGHEGSSASRRREEAEARPVAGPTASNAGGGASLESTAVSWFWRGRAGTAG